MDWLASVAVVLGSFFSLLVLLREPHSTLGVGEADSCCILAGLCKHKVGNIAGQGAGRHTTQGATTAAWVSACMVLEAIHHFAGLCSDCAGSALTSSHGARHSNTANLVLCCRLNPVHKCQPELHRFEQVQYGRMHPCICSSMRLHA